MRNLARDTRSVWVSLYESKEKQMDGGMWTGEYIITRSDPVQMFPTLTAARGSVDAEVFGLNVDYDRTATFDTTDTGIEESAVFWVDAEPEFEDGHLVVDGYGQPTVPWDYVVALIAVSPNVTSIALRKVDVQ